MSKRIAIRFTLAAAMVLLGSGCGKNEKKPVPASDATDSPASPNTAPSTKDGRHHLADEPLKLIPKRKQKLLLLQERIEAAEERAKNYKYLFGGVNATPPVIPKTGQKGISLAEATEGIEGEGPLEATIRTNYGKIKCTLTEEEAPKGVALFVGLARGIAKWWNRRVSTWASRPFYTNTLMYKVRTGELVHGGLPPQAGESALLRQTTMLENTEKKPPALEPYTLALYGGNAMVPLQPNFVISASKNPPLELYVYAIGNCTQSHEVIQKIAGMETTADGIPLEEIEIKDIVVSR